MQVNSLCTSIVTWILSFTWTLFVTCVVINWNVNTSQGHILRPAHRLIGDIKDRQNTRIVSMPNSQHEPEIAQIKFITGLRHKRDLSERDFHIIQVYRPSTNSTTVIHLHKKNSLVSHDFKVVIKNGEDEEPEVLSGEEVKSDCLYHGSIPSDPEGKAALSACGENFGFSGLVMSRDGHWMIEPHLDEIRSFQETLEIPHIIHLPEPQTPSQCNSDELRVPLEDLRRAAEAQRSSNDTKDEETNDALSDNGLSFQDTMIEGGNSEEEMFDETSGHIVSVRSSAKSHDSGSEGKSKKRQTTTSTKKTVEIAVFADADFYSKMKIRYPKNTADKVKNYVLTVMNSMDLLYEQPSLGTPLEFRLVHLEIQQKWPTKLSNKHKGKAKQYLSTFCDYAGDLNIRNELWDHALMLTGMDLVEDGSSATAGLAWAGTMCYRYYSCSISEATQFGVVYVITHEIGHSMGMEHDGSGVSAECDKDKYLMSPTTGPGKVAWSNCSSQNLKDFIQYGTSEQKERLSAVMPECLTESSRETRTIDYKSSSLPGQKYDADKQCALAMGKKFTSVVRKTSPFNNICSMLYCGNTTHSISTHPALEGTTCETGKYCRAGQCVIKK